MKSLLKTSESTQRIVDLIKRLEIENVLVASSNKQHLLAANEHLRKEEYDLTLEFANPAGVALDSIKTAYGFFSTKRDRPSRYDIVFCDEEIQGPGSSQLVMAQTYRYGGDCFVFRDHKEGTQMITYYQKMTAPAIIIPGIRTQPEFWSLALEQSLELMASDRQVWIENEQRCGLPREDSLIKNMESLILPIIYKNG
jgi:hypothetical protein